MANTGGYKIEEHMAKTKPRSREAEAVSQRLIQELGLQEEGMASGRPGGEVTVPKAQSGCGIH